jgi:allantoicase
VYIDILQHIEDLKERLGAASKTYTAAAEAYFDHADLRAHADGRHVRLTAASVNPYVDQMDIDRGQDLYVYPFIRDKGAVIHSDPHFFYIGSRNNTGFGVNPAQGWEEEMKNNAISSDVVKKVKDFLNANVPYGLPDESIKT